MQENHEELILRNPAFGAIAFWHLSRSFSDHSEGRAPSLVLFVISAGMLHQSKTVKKISTMQFESGLLKAISDMPEIVAGLQRRIEGNLPHALAALQVGSSAGILQREADQILPSFRALGVDLPIQIRKPGSYASPTLHAAKRLGAWFSAESLATIQARLRITL